METFQRGRKNLHRKLTVVGCGPGDPDYLTPVGLKEINHADILVGARHLLNLFTKRLLLNKNVMLIEIGKDPQKTLNEIEARFDKKVERPLRVERPPRRGNIVVAVTGDPGLFSFSKLIVNRFGSENCRIIPGISSLQMAFARIGLDWANVHIINAHGCKPSIDPAIFSLHDKIAIFLGNVRAGLAAQAGLADHEWILDFMKAYSKISLNEGLFDIFLMENLSLENENIEQISQKNILEIKPASRSIILFIKRGATPARGAAPARGATPARDAIK